MALGIRIARNAGGAVTVAEGADVDGLEDADCTVMVIDDDEVLATVPCPYGVDRDMLFDLLSSAEGGRWPDGIGIAYTTGDCDLLAVAFDRAAGSKGRIVGIADPLDDDWQPIDGAPYLVHAGYLIGGAVYDVEGATPIEAWSERWGALGSPECSLEHLDREDLERMQAEKMAEERIAKAADCASLIMAIDRLFPEPRSAVLPVYG